MGLVSHLIEGGYQAPDVGANPPNSIVNKPRVNTYMCHKAYSDCRFEFLQRSIATITISAIKTAWCDHVQDF